MHEYSIVLYIIYHQLYAFKKRNKLPNVLINTIHLFVSDSVLESLVPKDEKVEEFIDLKAGNLLTNSEYYR